MILPLKTIVLPIGDGVTVSTKKEETDEWGGFAVEYKKDRRIALKKPELLIPASCLEVLKTAVNFGADAVYIGGEVFSLRAKSKNFSKEDMIQGIAYAHAKGRTGICYGKYPGS